jgi:hypothetical protein
MLSKRTRAGLFFGDPPRETDANRLKIAGRFNVAAASSTAPWPPQQQNSSTSSSKESTTFLFAELSINGCGCHCCCAVCLTASLTGPAPSSTACRPPRCSRDNGISIGPDPVAGSRQQTCGFEHRAKPRNTEQNQAKPSGTEQNRVAR